MADDTWVNVYSFCLLHSVLMIIMSAVLTDTMKKEPTKEITKLISYSLVVSLSICWFLDL